MRIAVLLFVAALSAVAHAQDDEHRSPLQMPAAAPWLTGSDLLRKLNSPSETAAAIEYLKGIYDATEHKEWCHIGPNWQRLAQPRPLDLAAHVRSVLDRLPADQLKRSAGALVLEAWQDKWPCPSVEGSGCCP